VIAVVLPQARRGLGAALLLGFGRALGETIAVFLVIGRQDNQLPSPWFSARPLVEAGQTITSKLGGSETSIAYGDPVHWAAIVGLALVLLFMTCAVTIVATTGGGTRMRKLVDRLFALAVILCATIAAAILVGLMAVIAQRGGPAISWSFLTEQIRLVGAAGGILWNLIGTMILLASAFIICAPMAVALALVAQVWVAGERARRLIRTALYTLNGIPTIVLGIFGFIVFVQWCGWGKSWLAGGIVLAMSMLPTVTIALIERIQAIPSKYLEAAAGLGLSQSQIVWSVLLPSPGADSSRARCLHSRGPPGKPRRSCSPLRSSPEPPCPTASRKARCFPPLPYLHPCAGFLRSCGRLEALGRRARSARARLFAQPTRLAQALENP
jgi:ABC-type phosphate transport system permease subunit